MLKRLLKPILGPSWRVVNPPLRRFGLTAFRHAVDLARTVAVMPPVSDMLAMRGQRFLIVNLTPHLGDTIMQMPLIEALREVYPEARIECAIEASAASLLKMMPSVDRVYDLPLGTKPPVTGFLAVQRIGRVVAAYRRRMRDCQADVCIAPRWGDDLYRSLCLAYLVGAPRRIGFASDVNVAATQPAPYRDALLTETVAGANGIHESDRYLHLLRKTNLLSPEFKRSANELGRRAIQGISSQVDWPLLARRIGVDPTRRFAVIAPGASHPRRIWPIARWAEVAEALQQQGWPIVLLSGKQDAAVVLDLHELLGRQPTLVAGATSLPESVALIAHAGLFLGSDSGPGHIAGTSGVPSVILFVVAEGVSDDHHATPVRIGPLGDAVAICRPSAMLVPCGLSCEADEAHCIRNISVGQVLAGMAQALESTTPRIGFRAAQEMNC